MNVIKESIRTIPDFPIKDIMFRDVTTLYSNPKALNKVVNETVNYWKDKQITAIAGIEARGFIFGSAVAIQCNLPFIPIRKKNKLPGTTYKQKYKLEYGEDEIQVHKNAANNKDKVLIIDDLIATGGTAIAAAKLINKFNPKSIEFYFIINLVNLDGLKKLERNYKSNFILQAEG